MSFQSKTKEPELSDEISKIIERSFGEDSNSATDEIIRYKHKIMEILTNNQDILNTLHCTELEENGNENNGDAYRDVCLFDYLKLPDFKTNVRNYICFDVRNGNPYDTYMTRRIIFRVVCHLDEIKTD